MSAAEFRRRGREMVDFIADYWEQLDAAPDDARQRPAVRSSVQPGEVFDALPPHAPEQGEPWESILADVSRVVMPGLTHWQSPSFFGYFPADGSFPAILGDLLSTGLGVQGMLWQTSPACTELETRVLDWLAEAIGLPSAFLSVRGGGKGGGVIQSTASEAVLVSLLAARHTLRAWHAHAGGSTPLHPTIYTSTQAHSSVIKAAMVAGLADSADDRAHVRLVGVNPDGSMDTGEFARLIREDIAHNRHPCFVAATLGATGIGAMDRLDEIHEAVRAAAPPHAPWLHVDAAWAGSALVCPEHRSILRGVEHADSFSCNPHKWLLTSFDCSCLWLRDSRPLTDALSITPEYIRNAATDSGAVIDYRDWQVPLGRRFRSLKLWFVLRHYGIAGLQSHIREHVRLAELFESWIQEDNRFDVPVPRSLSLVCFRLIKDANGRTLSPEESDAATRALMDRLNDDGEVFLTHTVLPPEVPHTGGRLVIRMAIGATLTQERHVRRACELIRDAAGN